MDQEDGEHESRRGELPTEHVWDKLLHTDDRRGELPTEPRMGQAFTY